MRRPRQPGSTSPSTGCGATQSSSARFRAGTGATTPPRTPSAGTRRRCPRPADRASVQSPRMILENGVVRTMDPSLPTARALAIAGAHVAGGVGTHEEALPSPDVVDLGGRCVLPGFTDSHVHFPTWSLSQHDVKLDGVTGLR